MRRAFRHIQYFDSHFSRFSFGSFVSLKIGQ
jgi:hypothetical protein